MTGLVERVALDVGRRPVRNGNRRNSIYRSRFEAYRLRHLINKETEWKR